MSDCPRCQEFVREIGLANGDIARTQTSLAAATTASQWVEAESLAWQLRRHYTHLAGVYGVLAQHVQYDTANHPQQDVLT